MWFERAQPAPGDEEDGEVERDGQVGDGRFFSERAENTAHAFDDHDLGLT